MMNSSITIGIEHLQIPTDDKSPAELAKEVEELEKQQRIAAAERMKTEKISNSVNKDE